jgi:hypothetical protein
VLERLAQLSVGVVQVGRWPVVVTCIPIGQQSNNKFAKDRCYGPRHCSFIASCSPGLVWSRSGSGPYSSPAHYCTRVRGTLHGCPCPFGEPMAGMSLGLLGGQSNRKHNRLACQSQQSSRQRIAVGSGGFAVSVLQRLLQLSVGMVQVRCRPVVVTCTMQHMHCWDYSELSSSPW